MKFLHKRILKNFILILKQFKKSQKIILFEREVPIVKVNKIRMRETIISYAFLAPVLFFFIVFVLVPMIMGFITSFFNYSMTSLNLWA